MWIESPMECGKSIINMPLPSQQARKVLEDLRTNCCSPNRTLQLEALKCWGVWINNQNPDDWKLKNVCFTAVRPLITKTMQPLHKDVDICKLKLSLMWALLVQAQNLMQLEGPQYILEVFLQSCLSWLASCNGDGCENEISTLVFQLVLGLLNKNETITGCDREMFLPLTIDIFHSKKVFYSLADKFLNIFTHWRKVHEKEIVLKSWKNFLERCEQSCNYIPVPIWHKLFKLVGQICSEKSEPVKVRLAFLHSCATTLKSALSSPKFIDFGNLLTTPCEALLKKLVELCTVETEEVCDPEMFLHSKEVCQMLSDMSVAIGGFDLCIGVIDVLEEFWLRDLLWGVWCGLVHCFKVRLRDIGRKEFTKPQMIFHRKLRGIAANFELDRDILHKDCVTEVEKHIDVLNIKCLCSVRFKLYKHCTSESALGKMEAEQSKGLVRVSTTKTLNVKSSETLNFDLISAVLKNVGKLPTKDLCNGLFRFRYIKSVPQNNRIPVAIEFGKVGEDPMMSCPERKSPATVPESTPVKKTSLVPYEKPQNVETDEEIVSTPRTRSKKRAEEEEERKRELENQNRKRRRTFEVLVQEIVKQNKKRKTEKNRSSNLTRRSKKKLGKENRVVNDDRKLRKSSREKEKGKEKLKNPIKSDGKLENYFKVITKKFGDEKGEEKKSKKGKKKKKKEERSCCNGEKEEGKGEFGWRQTSLKTMMNRKKQEKGKPEVRTRSKATGANEEKTKGRKGRRGRKVTGNPLAKVVGSPISKVRGSPISKIVGGPISKSVGSPHSKLNPFKKVFHDHKYAKKKPQEFQSYERLLTKQKMEKKAEKTKNKQKIDVSNEEKDFKNCDVNEKRQETFEKRLVKKEKTIEADNKGETVKTKQKAIKPEVEVTTETEAEVPESCVSLEFLVRSRFQKYLSKVETEKKTKKTSKPVKEPRKTKLEVPVTVESEAEDIKTCEVTEEQQEAKVEQEQPETLESNFKKPEEEPEILKAQEKSSPAKETLAVEVQSIPPPPIKEIVKTEWETSMEEKTLEENPIRRGKKRIRMLENAKSNKKVKLEEEIDPQEEKLAVEIIEKENLEDFQSKLVCPSKKEKSDSKAEESPNWNGMISSRALRMIALLPESTKGGQMQRESSTRTEVLKCKKAPNVDKNSRASKMLALLSENVTEVEEAEEEKTEELPREVTTTPNVKTPVSSMKSPKSIKKRRSIRFDDARNETVLYQTDTPPSQILEDREKCRRVKPTSEC